MRLPLVGLAGVLVLAGCGTSERTAAPSTSGNGGRTVSGHRICDASRVPAFRTCMGDTIPLRPTIEHWTGSEWKVVTGPLPHPESSATWGQVSLSPDGRTLLAEWSYPCDSAAVVFVSVEGGKPGLVTGERDWRKAPQARALGWTPDGKARVRILTTWRGHRITPMHPRTFLIDPSVPPADAHPAPLSGC